METTIGSEVVIWIYGTRPTISLPASMPTPSTMMHQAVGDPLSSVSVRIRDTARRESSDSDIEGIRGRLEQVNLVSDVRSSSLPSVLSGDFGGWGDISE